LPVGFFFATRNITAEKATANGFEAAINGSIFDEWGANFAYTYGTAGTAFDPA